MEKPSTTFSDQARTSPGSEPSTINAQESQGLIYHPTGDIQQQFGNVLNLNIQNINFAGLAPLLAATKLSPNDLKHAFKYALPEEPFVPSAATLQDMFLKMFSHISDMPPQMNGVLPFLVFLDYIGQTLPTSPLKEQFDMWLQQTAQTLSQPYPALETLRSLSSKSKTSHPLYLIIQIHKAPETTETRFRISAWLVQQDHWENLSSDDLNYTFQELQQAINTYLEKINTALLEAKNKLIIEVFLPVDLLNWDIEWWTCSDDEDGWDNHVVGEWHPVVVRSLERLKKPKLRPRWEELWNHTAQVSPTESGGILHICEENSCADITAKLRASVTPCATISTPPLLIAEPKYNILLSLLSQGVPIILWPRKIPTPYDADKIQQALRGTLNVTEWSAIPEQVKRVRVEHSNTVDRVEQHFVLLWDDPTRTPRTDSFHPPTPGAAA